MKRLLTMLLVASLAVIVADVASANDFTPRVDRREGLQHARIHQGVRSGELTRGEAMRLRGGQRHVNRMECRAKADGHVTRGERLRLQGAQNRQSRNIWRMKHNARERW